MNSQSTFRPPGSTPGHGAVAIVCENEKFLVIRRSATVRAPNMLCFAGGTIEAGETPESAVVREMDEELSLAVIAQRHVWKSTTAWGTRLEWILVDRAVDSQPVANPLEVADWMWLTAGELLIRPDLLPSVPDFYYAWARGEFELPRSAGLANRAWLDLKK